MNEKSMELFRTIRDYLTIYLEKQKCVSCNTLISYKQTINQYLNYLTHHAELRFEDINFTDWNIKNISGYLDYISEEQKLSAASRNQRLAALRAFIKYARINHPETAALSLELQMIPVKKEVKKPVDFLTEAAIKSIFKQPDCSTKKGIRDLCLMVLMYDCAARDREILNLRVNSISLNQPVATAKLEGKGSKIRLVPLMEKTVLHLKRYLDKFHPEGTRNGADYLFYTVIHGKRHQMSDDNVARLFSTYSKTARNTCMEVPEHVHPHQIRHSRAMHLYRGGMPLPLLSEFMGHSSMQTTTIYAYADTEMKRKAIEKASRNSNIPEIFEKNKPEWQTDPELIRKLYGLS